MSRYTLAWLAIWFITAAAGTYAGHVAEMRVRQAQALQCARTSDGTDSSIAACYTRRDLSIPEDL